MDRNAQSSSSGRKLTPIHMRGKRKSNRSPASSSSSQNNGTDSDTAAAAAGLTLDSPRKRSREPDPNRGCSSAAAGDKVPARRVRTQKNASFDQRFPLEVIERIFFFSKNYNLPIASTRLGWMLSSRHTLRDLVLDAFGPYWNLAMTNRYKEPRPRSAAAAKKKRALKASKITALLERPWSKMDLLLEAQQIWLQKNRKKGKRYVHTIVPAVENADKELAAKFVLNMDDLKKLEENHVAPHIISISMMENGEVEPDEYSEDEYEEDSEDFDKTEDVDGDDEAPRRRQVREEEEEDDDEDGGDADESEEEEQTEEPIEMEPENASAHVCFALDQYFILEMVCREGQFDNDLDDQDIMELLEADPLLPWGKYEEKEEMSAAQLMMYRMSCAPLRKGPNLGWVRVPEWLQLAGGPYPRHDRVTKRGRKAMRDRLRSAFDMLTWLVCAGVQLHERDSWELTWQGFQNLLEVDVRAQPWDAYEEGEDVVAVHHSNNGRQAPTEKPIRLQYTVDIMVAGMLSHFYALGVFFRFWPESILAEAMEKAKNFGDRDGGALRKTYTYRQLQRVALVTPAKRDEADEWLMQTWGEVEY